MSPLDKKRTTGDLLMFNQKKREVSGLKLTFNTRRNFELIT